MPQPKLNKDWHAKHRMPAGATLEQGGQTLYFIDESTKTEFAKQKGAAPK